MESLIKMKNGIYTVLKIALQFVFHIESVRVKRHTQYIWPTMMKSTSIVGSNSNSITYSPIINTYLNVETDVDKSHNGKKQQFSFLVGVAFTLNYIMGTGFLTLPWAFYKSGYVLGTIVMFALIIPSSIAVLFVLEAMARASCLSELGNHKMENSHHSKLLVGEKKYEIPELCEIFLGSNAKQLYTFTISLYLYGALWAYATVFANSMTSNISLGQYSYHIYLAIYGACVAPISCMELSEQISVQVILAFCRALMVIVMVFTVICEMGRESHEVNAFQQGSPGAGSNNAIDWSGLRVMLPIACYGYVFHHSIPALSEPVKDKSHLATIFNTALIFCFVSYCFIGILLSVYFGPDIQSSSNLNWSHYGYFTSHIAQIAGRILKFYVLIFPALDVFSVFPLCAVTLGNNLHSSLHSICSSSANTPPDDAYRPIPYRLLAAFPPLIGAALVSSLGNITNFSGITGFAVCFVFPPLLAYYSKHNLIKKNLDPKTRYSSWFTSDFWIFAILIFGVSVIIYTISCLVVYGPPE